MGRYVRVAGTYAATLPIQNCNHPQSAWHCALCWSASAVTQKPFTSLYWQGSPSAAEISWTAYDKIVMLRRSWCSSHTLCEAFRYTSFVMIPSSHPDSHAQWEIWCWIAEISEFVDKRKYETLHSVGPQGRIENNDKNIGKIKTWNVSAKIRAWNNEIPTTAPEPTSRSSFQLSHVQSHHDPPASQYKIVQGPPFRFPNGHGSCYYSASISCLHHGCPGWRCSHL